MKVGQELIFRMNMNISDMSVDDVPSIGDIVTLKDREGNVQRWEIEEVFEDHIQLVMKTVLELRP